MLAHVLVAHLLAASAANASDATIVLGLGDDPRVFKRLDIVRRMSPFGEPATAVQVLGWMSGIAEPALANIGEMRAKLDRADDLDAEYQLADARQLRTAVIAAYDHSPVPEPAAGVQAALATQDMAGQLVTSGKKKDALAAFTEQQRRFPTVSIDMNKHRPDIVALYEKAASEMKKQPQQKITVSSNRPGLVMLDGRSLGAIANDANAAPGTVGGKVTASVPRGRYLLWMSDAGGRSLTHVVDVGAAPLSVTIDFDLEQRIVTEPTFFVRCASDCDQLLTRLQKATQASRVIGVRMVSPDVSEAVVADSTGVKTEPLQTIDEIADPPLTASAKEDRSHRVSPWSVAPLGIAQFTQHRPVAGAIFASLSAGAIAWNVASSLRDDNTRGSSVRAQQNISAGLVIGVVLAAAIEGFVQDWSDPEYP